MVWIILFLCLGLVGFSGYRRGPIRAGFSLLGLLFGIVLAKPLSPLTARLLPLLGFHHPLWGLFMPGVLAFLFVVVIFKIVGGVLHEKVVHIYKDKEEEQERLFFRWQRLYCRLGLCVGLANGVLYFFILMMPVYVAGYFTTEASGADLPAGARLLTSLRADLHDSKLDRVVAARDPIPPEIYQASDIIDLVLRNPSLADRLSHYPPLLSLGEQPEIKEMATDTQLQQMIQSQASIKDILAEPNVQALVTNTAVTDQIRALVGQDLGDLQTYLNTGKSPKFDAERILGLWTIDLGATVDEERKRNPDFTARQIAALRTNFIPVISGLSLTATTDNQMILKKQNPDTGGTTAVGSGTWKNSGDDYEIALSGNKPDVVEATLDAGGALHFPRDNHILIFDKAR